jgi:hypothetical protein
VVGGLPPVHGVPDLRRPAVGAAKGGFIPSPVLAALASPGRVDTAAVIRRNAAYLDARLLAGSSPLNRQDDPPSLI